MKRSRTNVPGSFFFRFQSGAHPRNFRPPPEVQAWPFHLKNIAPFFDKRMMRFRSWFHHMAFRFPPAVKFVLRVQLFAPPHPRQRPGRHQKVLRRWKLCGEGDEGFSGVLCPQKTDDDHHTRMYGFRFFVVVGILYWTDLDFIFIFQDAMPVNRMDGCMFFIGLRATVAWWKIPMYECESPCIVWKCFF